jgi:FkbM family methyltransferase
MFISYAQNFEDVILWRALKHVDIGFYIDIGAQDPQSDSVSFAFYKQGWSGVHVEPSEEYAAALRRERPNEIVVEAVVGETNGEALLFEMRGTGLSTTDSSLAARQAAAGRTVQTIRKLSIRLSDVLDAHKDREIHWLKIDVEGSEGSVIRSWGPSLVRPWIVVVEYMDPISQEDTSSQWAPDICLLGYEPVYTDGLNKFFLHETHSDLRKHFGAGPNVFDGFALSGTQSAPFSLHLKQQLDRSASNEEDLAARLAEQTIALETARTEYQSRYLVLADAQREVTHLHSILETTRKEHAVNQADLTTKLTESYHEIARLHAVVQHQNKWGEASVAHVGILSSQLTAFSASTSWRITKPLRAAKLIGSTATERVHRLPRAIVTRTAGLFRRRAPKLYGRIAVSRSARKLYALLKNPAVAPHRNQIAPAPLVDQGAAVCDEVISLMDQSSGGTLSPTVVGLTSNLRNWNLGKRLDA